MSEQVRFAPNDPKNDEVATLVPASGLTQLFPIHENDEDLFPVSVPFHEVPCMVDTVLVNVDPSSGLVQPFAIHENDYQLW